MFEFNIKTVSAIIAILIVIGAYIPYILEILKRRTKPHLYTWIIWFITQSTALAGLWIGNGGWGAVALIAGTILVFCVILLSFWYGTRNITKSDTIVLILALLAIFVWWQLDNPLMAVFMVTAIDLFGYIPSWRKSITEPWSETTFSWIAFSTSNIFTVLALTEYNLLTVTYISAITVANLILVGICLYFRRTVPKPTQSLS